MRNFKLVVLLTLNRRALFLLSLVFSLGFSIDVYAQFIPDLPDRPDFFERGREQWELEIDRLQRQQPESIPLVEFDIDSPQWSTVLLHEGGGVVWMPQGIMSHDTETVESVDGLINFDVISSTSDIGQFVVAFSEKVNRFANAAPSELLNRVRDRIISDQNGFEAVGDRVIIFNDYPGQEFTLQNDEEVITFRVLLVQDRLYVMAVSQSTDSKQKEAITTFFNSFQPL